MTMEQLTIVCRMCAHGTDLSVNAVDLERWRNRELLAQEAFPYLDADQRELLISQTCPTCWEAMFGQDDADELE
jgi:hypothetical protein